MKKAISLFLLLSFVFLLCSCSAEKTPILDNSDKSYFVDFYTDDKYVYIECVLNIYNPNNMESEVSITAIDNEDVEIGLLKSENLTGYKKDSDESVFKLKSGENTVTVLFRGDYAGIPQISARAIPRFICIKEA